MLLILLLLLWARAPMRFAPRWKRSLIIVVIALALAAPWIDRGSGPSTAAAADRFGAASGGRSDRTPAAGSSSKSEAGSPGLLREGTRVSATTGRFVLSGSRWNFVPDPPPRRASRNGGSVPDGSPGPVAGTGRGAAPAPSQASQASDGKPPAESPVAADQASQTGERRVRGLRRRTIVAENLMLQRVVEAIRADPDDDRWTVTGEVAEFFGENRLRLQTVQRSTGR